MDSGIARDVLAEAIKTCDRDPIHIPGSIQSFGYLVATDRQVDRLVAVSANLADALGKPDSDLLALAPDALLTEEQLHGVRNVLGHDTISSQREYVGMTTLGGQEHQVSVHRKGPHALIEFTPERAPVAERFLPMEEARRFLVRDPAIDHPQDILRGAVDRLRALVGYDRVKAYLFLPNDDGEVIAESRRTEMPSFLGLRFPASDIPKQPRALYASTPLRLISDVAGANVPLLVRNGSASDIDLSLAVLRGTDPVHIQYLSNMGVGGTLSIPVVVRGRLYALFACHSATPRAPDASALMAAELAGKLIGLQVEHALELRRQSRFRHCTALASRVFVADDSELSAGPNMLDAADNLRELLPSDGLALSISGELHRKGDTPSVPACHELFAQDGHDDDGLLGLNGLGERVPDASWGQTAGALILKLSDSPPISLAFLRNQSEGKLSWAGVPDKDVEKTDDGVKLNPRNSFEQYVQRARGRCDDWSGDDVTTARALRSALIEALGTQQAMRDHRHRLGLMVRELNHRVRNILALVQSLTVQSRASATSIEQYADLLEKRITALSGAHNLLTRNEMSGVALSELAELELKPFGNDGSSTTIDGPEVWLTPDGGPVVALVLHELTSNAAKYGALCVPDGRIELSWAFDDRGLEMHWRELGGPDVVVPDRRGFGRSIIEHALSYELGGRSELTFHPDGVEARLWLPGEMLTGPPPERLAESAGRRGAPEPPPDAGESRTPATPAPVGQRAALVVEDNYLVAIQSKSLLAEEGFGPVHTASTIAEALYQIEINEYAFCLLDVDLQGSFSSPVAAQLRRRNIPFLFATGYGSDGADIAAEFAVPVLPKPLDRHAIRAALAKLESHGD